MALLVGLAVLLTVAVVALTSQLLPEDGPGGTSVIVGPHPLAGKPAPDFTLFRVVPAGPASPGASATPESVTLSSLRGRPVVLNFWAPSCVPCRSEFPVLRSALAAHASSGLVLLGIWYRGGRFLDNPDEVTSFMAEQRADWPTLADPDGTVQRAYDVVVPPTTFFIDRAGVVRAVQLGEMTAELLERQLAKIE